jgi:D-3-phosphoglycerate dehydrogenase
VVAVDAAAGVDAVLAGVVDADAGLDREDQLAALREGADGDLLAEGDLAEGRNDMIVNAVLVGLFKPILESGVTPVNARTIATDRGIEIIESRSSRPRNYTSLMSVKLHTTDGERWVEGAVFERTAPRLVLVDGIGVEAPLEGTMIVIRNNDQPGVIGEIGTILGRHGVNIANFALGREGKNAIGVVIVDETSPIPDAVLEDLRKVKAIREARIVRV